MDSYSHTVARLQVCSFNLHPDSAVSKVLRADLPLFTGRGEEAAWRPVLTVFGEQVCMGEAHKGNSL